MHHCHPDYPKDVDGKQCTFVCQAGCVKAVDINGQVIGHCIHELYICKVVKQAASATKLYAQSILIPEGKLISTQTKSKGIPSQGLVILSESDIKEEDKGNTSRIMTSIQDREFNQSLTMEHLEHAFHTGESITAASEFSFVKTGLKRGRKDREVGNEFGALRRVPKVRTILSKPWAGRDLWNVSKTHTVPKGYESRVVSMEDD